MPDFPDTIDSLIIRVRDPSNRCAWEEFEQLYRPVIYRISRARGLQDADAMDVVQQVLISVASAIQRYEKLDDGTPFRHWLNRVTHNAVLKALNYQLKHKSFGNTGILDLLPAGPEDQETSGLLQTEYRRELYQRAAERVRADVQESTWMAFELTALQSISVRRSPPNCSPCPPAASMPHAAELFVKYVIWSTDWIAERHRKGNAMEPVENTCDNRRLVEYLEETLTEAEASALEDHLGHCSWCRDQLEQTAAEPDVWEDALALLQPSPSVGSTDADPSNSPDSVDAALDSILRTLAPTDDPQMLGRLGDYEISGVVGVGGMGAVLKGYDRALKRVVAVKMMAPHLANSGSARARFQREARAAAAITHSNVIDTYGVSEAGGLPYLVMPFARGPSLQKRIDEGGPLTTIEVVRIGYQTAAGLQAAHERGLVHRDIKPANILLNEGVERLWITDFGVARAIDDASMTRTGVIAGTPQFMSPEQARGEFVDHRSDLFSLGSVLYTACTGRVPFRAEAAYGILRRITDTEPASIQEINPDIPGWLVGIIERLMAKSPDHRYASAGEVATLLENCLAHLQQPHSVPLPPEADSLQAHCSPPSANSLNTAKTSTRLFVSPSVIFRKEVILMLTILFTFVASVAGWQYTSPPEIEGDWDGKSWQDVRLHQDDDSPGQYTGTFFDESGRRGDLRLAWSRVQRQFVGRWSLNNDVSGELTARVSGARLRGAIVVDADTETPPGTTRLRDFLWRKAASSNPTAGETDASSETPLAQDPPRADSSQQLPTVAPAKGRIQRWSEGIREGSRVEQGQVVVEIDTTDPGQIERWDDQVRNIELRLLQTNESIKSAADLVVTAEAIAESRRNVATGQAKLLEQQLADHQQKLDELAKRIEELQEGEQTAIATRDSLVAEVNDLKADLPDDADTSSELSVAEFRLLKNQALMESLRNNLTAETQQLENLRSKESPDVIRVRVEAAEAEAILQAALGDAIQAKQTLQSLKSDEAALQAELQIVESKLARTQHLRIHAENDGQIINLHPTRMVKEGDSLFTLIPDGTAAVPNLTVRTTTSAGEQPPPETSSLLVAGRLQRLSEAATGNTLPLVRSITTALNLGREYRLVTSQLQSEDNQKEDSEHDRLQRRREELVTEKDAIIQLLRSKLQETKDLFTSRSRTANAVRRPVDVGELSWFENTAAQESVITPKVQLAQTELLLAYYQTLDTASAAADGSDSEFVLGMIQEALNGGKERAQLLADRHKQRHSQFSTGLCTLDEVLSAEEDKISAFARIRELEVLFNYWQTSETAQPSNLPSAEEDPLAPAFAEDR